MHEFIIDRMREAQARYKEEMKIKIEEDKKRRAEERIKENKRKKEEQKIIKELIQVQYLCHVYVISLSLSSFSTIQWSKR